MRILVEGRENVGVTAGASAPESLVQLILARLAEFGVTAVRELEGESESVVFQMPPELETDEALGHRHLR